MSRGLSATALLFLFALCACGGGTTETTVGGTTGGAQGAGADDQSAASDLLPPATPGRSASIVLDEPYRYVIRSDISQVRGTPLEPEIRRLLEAIPQWRAVLEVSDLDPINDIEAIIAGAPGRGSKEYVMLARHNAPLEQVREFVVAIAASQGQEVEWGEHDGIPVAGWPGEAEVVQSVALPRDNWLVLGPSSEVARFIAISKTEGSELVSGFPMPWDGGAVVDEGAGLMGTGRGVMGGEEERPHYPDNFSMRIWGESDGGVTARWQGHFEDAAEAEAAQAHWGARRDEYAGNPMLSLLGLSSAIEGAHFTRDEGDLEFQLTLTQLQMSRLVRFATPVIVGGRRGNRNPGGASPEAPATE